ncbi:isocitrate lyase/phosphoenolpyruvate mutase family protein, partial [Streptomyces sp. ISL-94]|uniref:isocitrate lyase/phosphoenolpyruvate mutase family protein n=1 Tax=Streptomyces sp. ISL-94 TaxID=2819190 RepID=UPI001BE9DACD
QRGPRCGCRPGRGPGGGLLREPLPAPPFLRSPGSARTRASVAGAAQSPGAPPRTKGIDAPLNILVGPGAPTVAELGTLGVARVSLGSWVAEAAYAVVRRATEELLSGGTYGSLAHALPYGELNSLLKG